MVELQPKNLRNVEQRLEKFSGSFKLGFVHRHNSQTAPFRVKFISEGFA